MPRMYVRAKRGRTPVVKTNAPPMTGNFGLQVTIEPKRFQSLSHFRDEQFVPTDSAKP
jgi:hypothetical protein